MAKPIILCDCAGMANDRWLECRAHGPKGDIPYTVGGSDVAAIFGLSPLDHTLGAVAHQERTDESPCQKQRGPVGDGALAGAHRRPLV